MEDMGRIYEKNFGFYIWCYAYDDKFMDVEFNHPEIFNVESVKTSEVWREILNLADEIKELLYY